MAQKIETKSFKDGFAVIREGEVITRTETEAEALEYAERLKHGRQHERPATRPGEES